MLKPIAEEASATIVCRSAAHRNRVPQTCAAVPQTCAAVPQCRNNVTRLSPAGGRDVKQVGSAPSTVSRACRL